MQTPPPLQAGDRIGIVSTARKITEAELQPALKTFADWGLEVVLGKNLFAVYHQFAGTDRQRLADLQDMLDDPEIKAIVCARGGYGTARIIDDLNFKMYSVKPKWIVGFSDVTVLHSHIHTHCGTETLHAIMPLTFPGTPEAMESLRKALFGEPISYELDPHPFNREGSCSGQLVGGNLSILYSINNTPSDIDTTGNILFIEDLDEYLYHIDRMMLSLRRSGKLENLAGLIVGGMTKMNDNEVPFGKNAYEIIAETVKNYTYPLIFNFPAGHISDNRVLIIGRRSEMTVSERVRLRL